MDPLEGSVNNAMNAEIDRRINEAVNYYINAYLDHRPQQVIATFYAAGASFLPWFEWILAEAGGADWPSRAKITLLEGALSVKLRKALVTDNCKCFNCNQIGHIAVWCPRLKRSYPAKAKKVKKVKKAARPKESSSSATEELGSSETEESLGKE
ncbi:pol-like protein [Colletotrichum kahawae]|uniref:Pol-like protein n=1 Tax=Colletotrichum kahawae TaxID=34407 RepID=A0AAD9Y6T4_COLKA|nr:pol-like protein [Colletotrichum kahawae]